MSRSRTVTTFRRLFLTFRSFAVGRGGQGAVYLVRHMLNGEALGLYACKKGEARRHP